MPTGYTAKLYEGEEQTFDEFVMSCARAFGALILMRDDPADAPIPDAFEPSDYSLRALEKAEARLVELEGMKMAQAREAAQADWQKAFDARQEAERNRAARKERYEAMLAQVRQWEPPTPDHTEFKKFMIEQLQTSIDHDCSMDYWPELPEADAVQWRHDQIDKARRDIDYHREQYAKEVERTNQRNAWVRALRDSLGQKVG